MSNLTEWQRRGVEMMMESGECECEPFQPCEMAEKIDIPKCVYYMSPEYAYLEGYRAALQDKCKAGDECE